jgi:GDP-4-dehydro-6-deoxy-D-mannose reductase
VVPAFARQVARIAAGLQAPRMEVGALDPMRDFLDVRDVCDAYVAALAGAEALAPGTILNIASGTPRRIGDILAKLLHMAGVEAEIATAGGLLRRAEIPVACGDASAARAALGWAPGVPWERTLADVLEDWRHRVRNEA